MRWVVYVCLINHYFPRHVWLAWQREKEKTPILSRKILYKIQKTWQKLFCFHIRGWEISLWSQKILNKLMTNTLCACVCMCACARACVHACACMCVHACAHARTHICICVWICICIYVYIYIIYAYLLSVKGHRLHCWMKNCITNPKIYLLHRSWPKVSCFIHDTV